MTPDAKSYAAQYRAEGWAIVPIDPKSKTPIHADWPARAAEGFELEGFEGRNVGVVLGRVSGDLADVDLDSQAAIELAPYFLPPTLTFGRKSKPRSHWLYRSPGARAAKLWFHCGGERELVELRANNAASEGCGHQTVFPGSTHASGEAIEFDGPGGDSPAALAELGAGELLWALSRLAVASAILGDWGEGSGRHEKSKGLAGGLLKAGWTPDEVRDALAAVRECAGDSAENEADFSHDVESTIAAFEHGTEVTGFGTLIAEGFTSAEVVTSIERHAKTPEQRKREAQLASTAAGKGMRARMLAEAREVDGLTSAADYVASLGGSSAEPAPAVGGDLWASLPISFFDPNEEPAALEYVWACFAPGKVNAIVAFAYTGKTPFALALGLCIAQGAPFLGQPTKQRKVLYVAHEGQRNARRKAARLARGLGSSLAELADSFEIGSAPSGVLTPEYVAALGEACTASGVGVLVIDTYGSALDPAIDRNSAAFSAQLKQLGDISEASGIVVIVLMHERKAAPGKTPDLQLIDGHNSAAGALQGAISLSRPKPDEKHVIEVTCSRAPDEEFEPFRIRWEDVTAEGKPVQTAGERLAQEGLRAVVVTEAEQEASEAADYGAEVRRLMAEVVEIVTLKGPTGGPVAVADILAALPRKRVAAKNAIDNLARAGRLLADYAVGSNLYRKQSVWIPGLPESAAGVVQRPAPKRRH
jgi:hypothetical protein